MAKDFEEKFNKKDGYGKYRAINKMAEFYNVEGVRGPGYRGSVSGRPGANYGESGRGSWKTKQSTQRAINDAMLQGGVGDYLRYTQAIVVCLMPTIWLVCGLSIKKWRKSTRRTLTVIAAVPSIT